MNADRENVPSAEKRPWFQRLKAGLQRTSSQLTAGIKDIFRGQALDADMLAHLEELLILTDMGAKTSADLVSGLKKASLEKGLSEIEVRRFLAQSIIEKTKSAEKKIIFQKKQGLSVVMMVGVNGSGKTTTLGKLADQWRSQGYALCLAACDTFRAAAVDQLAQWADRAQVPLFRSDTHKDPASVAYDAYAYAQNQSLDLLMVDTAGRLHTRTDLMDELSKIVRVLRKWDAQAPQDIFLVLDGTLGQNALQQVLFFQKVVPLTGLVMTKLDGTAKGGILVPIIEETRLPVVAIGVGEGIEDLKPFSAHDYAYHLLGLDESDHV